MPTPADPRLSIETTLRAIDPRHDKDLVLLVVARALDNCDPDERPALQITRWPGAGHGCVSAEFHAQYCEPRQ